MTPLRPLFLFLFLIVSFPLLSAKDSPAIKEKKQNSKLSLTTRNTGEARITASFALLKKGKKIASEKGNLDIRLAPGKYQLKFRNLKGFKFQQLIKSDSITHASKLLKPKRNLITFTVKRGEKMELKALYKSKIKALSVTERVSVVDIRQSQASLPDSLPFSLSGNTDDFLAGHFSTLLPSGLPSYSDYKKDQPEIYVAERSDEALKNINEILCMMAQTRYEAMLNLGNYKAQVDLNLCSRKRDDSSSAGRNKSSNANMPDYQLWTVKTSRAGNEKPLTMKAWVHVDEEDKIIFLKSVVAEGKSPSNPYGIFTLNFRAHPFEEGTVDTDTELMKGFLKTGKDPQTKDVLLKFINVFYDSEDEGPWREKVTLSRASDGSIGGGIVSFSDLTSSPKETAKYDITFNPTRFLRKGVDGIENCFSRSDFEETSLTYGLYNIRDGSRVTLDSGFPIKLIRDEKEIFGWVGYWGPWFPTDIKVQHGETVHKLGYDSYDETGEAFTIFKSSGRLIKYQRQFVKLGDIRNIPLQWEDDMDGQEYVVEWDGENFNKVAVVDPENGEWESFTPPEPLILNKEDPFFSFWSEALGGNGFINLADPDTGDFMPLSDGTDIIFYIEETVFSPESVPKTLACFEDCPDPDKLDSGNPFFRKSVGEGKGHYEEQEVPVSKAKYISYTFNKNKMVLQKDGRDITLSGTNREYEDEIMSGPLFEPNENNLAKLECDWDPGITCAWKTWEVLDSFYIWEVGSNEWNSFTVPQDQNQNFLTFDPPINIKYVHTWEDNSTSTFYPEYTGFGELWGIPGGCVDRDAGEETPCEEGEKTRWVPELSIPDGTTVVDISDNKTMYLVKALEKEQRMKSLDLSECSSLTTSSFDLPSLDEWEDPDIGDEPKVIQAPAVVGGVIP